MTFTPPIITTDLAFAIARLVTGFVIAAHGAQKVFGVWGGPGLNGWTQAITRMGLRPARIWGPLTAVSEFVGGILLGLGFLTPIVAAIVTMQIGTALVRVHLPKGFFNSKGGIEFTLVLITVTVVSGLSDPGAWSLDRALGIPTLGSVAYLAMLIVAWIVYFVSSRTSPSQVSAGSKAA